MPIPNHLQKYAPQINRNLGIRAAAGAPIPAGMQGAAPDPSFIPFGVLPKRNFVGPTSPLGPPVATAGKQRTGQVKPLGFNSPELAPLPVSDPSDNFNTAPSLLPTPTARALLPHPEHISPDPNAPYEEPTLSPRYPGEDYQVYQIRLQQEMEEAANNTPSVTITGGPNGAPPPVFVEPSPAGAPSVGGNMDLAGYTPTGKDMMDLYGAKIPFGDIPPSGLMSGQSPQHGPASVGGNMAMGGYMPGLGTPFGFNTGGDFGAQPLVPQVLVGGQTVAQYPSLDNIPTVNDAMFGGATAGGSVQYDQNGNPTSGATAGRATTPPTGRRSGPAPTALPPGFAHWAQAFPGSLLANAVGNSPTADRIAQGIPNARGPGGIAGRHGQMDPFAMAEMYRLRAANTG